MVDKVPDKSKEEVRFIKNNYYFLILYNRVKELNLKKINYKKK